jgi:hypothetical protein
MTAVFPRVIGPARQALIVLSVLAALAPLQGRGSETVVSETDRRAAAAADLTRALAAPDPIPANWAHAQDLDHANRAFLAWQQESLRDASRLPPELRALARRKSVVPPLPASSPELDLPHQVHLSVPQFLDPDGRFAKELVISSGAPKVSLTLGVEGKLLSVVGASYKAGVAYATDSNEFAFTDSAEVQAAGKIGPVEVAGTYQFFSSSWKPSEEKGADGKPFTGQISADILMTRGHAGYNSNGELNVGGSWDFIKSPKPLEKLIAGAVNLNLDVDTPVRLRLATTGGTFQHPVVDPRYTEKVVRILCAPVPCPYCSAQGVLHCPRCSDRGTITCPDCLGKCQVTCGRCNGSKQVPCGRCDGSGEVTCFKCSGSGRLRCSTCGGSGHTTYYQTVSTPYEQLVVTGLGFDSSGQPTYERHYETRYREEQVPHSQTCPTCGGSGEGGTCPQCQGGGRLTCSRCDGTGKLTCSRCGGTGLVNCSTCDGTGEITCPICHGRITECPECHGKRKLGP